MKIIVLVSLLLLVFEGTQSFVPPRLPLCAKLHERSKIHKGNIRVVNKRAEPRKDVSLRRNAALGLPDFPLIPTILVATLGVFALFNINNDVDLTDAGRADARRKRRAERIARGEDLTGKSNPFKTDDPYRWRLFEDDTDDDNFEILNKK